LQYEAEKHTEKGHTNCKFRNSKMADGRYFEIVKAPHINQKVSDFDEIWCAEAKF